MASVLADYQSVELQYIATTAKNHFMKSVLIYQKIKTVFGYADNVFIRIVILCHKFHLYELCIISYLLKIIVNAIFKMSLLSK